MHTIRRTAANRRNYPLEVRVEIIVRMAVVAIGSSWLKWRKIEISLLSVQSVAWNPANLPVAGVGATENCRVTVVRIVKAVPVSRSAAFNQPKHISRPI